MDLPNELQGRALSRRQLLRYFGMLGRRRDGQQVGGGVGRRAERGARLVGRAASTQAAGSDLGAIDHIVFLMMENRSYDHYFGAYPRGRGFDDHPARFARRVRAGLSGRHRPACPPNVLLPFHLDSTAGHGVHRRSHPRLGTDAPVLEPRRRWTRG